MRLSDDEHEILEPYHIATHKQRKSTKMAFRIKKIGFVIVLSMLVIIYSNLKTPRINTEERLYGKIYPQLINESIHENRESGKYVLKNLSVKFPVDNNVTLLIKKLPPGVVEASHRVQKLHINLHNGLISKLNLDYNFPIEHYKFYDYNEYYEYKYYDYYASKKLYNNIHWSKKYKHSKTICKGRDWVSCNGFQCQVIPEIFEKMPMIACFYSDFVEYNVNGYFIGTSLRVDGNETWNFFFSDHVKISCDEFGNTPVMLGNVPKRQFWTGIKTGFRTVSVETPSGREKTPNILILALDSIPYHKFHKYLPRAFGVLTQELNAVVLQNYNVNNSDMLTTFNIIKNGFKLQDKQKLYRNIYLYPDNLLIKHLHDDGYCTGYFTDLSMISSKIYKYPTDYKLHYFFEENDRMTRVDELNTTFSDINCVGDTPKYALLLNITLQYTEILEKRFSFTFISNITNYPRRAVDDNLVYFIRSLKHVLRDTLFIFMTNQIFSKASQSTPNVEDLNQLVFIVLPRLLVIEKPQTRYNLMANRYMCTTPFDIDKTILDVVGLNLLGNDDNLTDSKLPDGRSLLQISRKVHQQDTSTAGYHGTFYLMSKKDFILPVTIIPFSIFWVFQ
ncbi:uncharacterized protein LOC113232641 [Hyposmocoma kahamanoa]|uniref:uncharacterized protein LOC113232641 n=1 Tax=Hyposmocoma kahamanoa TaxID=1477025 RepID=UPI000E6D8621|nr:uncharacterized protein LOC113232641 [Hyposmocoma kahamanoa]